MRKTKVLFVLHNHPSVKPGGTEAYTLRLHEALSASDEFEPLVLARVRGGSADFPGTRVAGSFGVIGAGPNQYFLPTDRERKDFFFGTYRDKSLYTSHIADFLRTVEPDVVHFQHTDYIGYDIVTLVRRVLPHAAIVYTLHEYLPICNHYGQMVRTGTGELCLEASPRRCHECFPEIAPQSFFLRKRLIQAHLSEVDLFIAPSRFLLERYVDWGIPPERIRHEDHGFFPVVPVDDREPPRRDRFGFFGVLTPFKGIDVLLRAMALLGPEFDGHLWIRGTSFEDDDDEAKQARERQLADTSATVTFGGPYDPADLPRLMTEIDWVVVPSVWWENSPLVIQEAFLHRRPVICSDVGGMAEKVRHEVDGLHFRVGDERSLAGVLRRVVTEAGLWERLRDGIPPVHTMDEHVEALTSIYRELLARHGSGVEGEAAGARW